MVRSLSNEELVILIKNGENEADNMLQLWEQNNGLIYKIAKKYTGFAELCDLMQEAYLGLCEAVRFFDCSKGFAFTTYLGYWIKQKITRYIDECCHTVRIPSHTTGLIWKYRKARNNYEKHFGKEPSKAEICSILGIGYERYEQLQKDIRIGQIGSLDAPVEGKEEQMSILDVLSSMEDLEEDVIRAVDAEQMAREIWIAVDDLPEKQAAAIRLRFQEGMTLKEVGSVIGVNTDRVRQIQNEGIRKLRQRSRHYHYRRYYEEYLSPAPIHHVGLSRFRQTWTSEVEWETLGY